jgi:Ca2+-transporting ATPase
MPTSEERESLIHGGSEGHFGISAKELGELIDPKNFDLLKKMGGVKSICKKIQVDTSVGLSADEGAHDSSHTPFEDRQAHFGRNVLPEPKTKTFFELLWAAYNDKTLIMLRFVHCTTLVT